MKIAPLEAIISKAAEDAAERLHAILPNARITPVLADVRRTKGFAGHRWTGFADAFAHLRTGLPLQNPHILLIAVLVDSTNLGLTRIADACAVPSYRDLAWTAGWHRREDTDRPALAILVNAQQQYSLATLFGAADMSISDGQAFLTAGRDGALGVHNAPHDSGGKHLPFSAATFRPGTRHSTRRPCPPARQRTSSNRGGSPDIDSCSLCNFTQTGLPVPLLRLIPLRH